MMCANKLLSACGCNIHIDVCLEAFNHAILILGAVKVVYSK